MVEKIREPFQKHARTISSVSDVSTTGAIEPLKRDENAEIRIVVLCDSETERHCVFEDFYKCLIDGQSFIHDVQLLHHHWEQPHNECTGLDCRYCIRGTGNPFAFSQPSTGGNGNGGVNAAVSVPGVLSLPVPSNSGDGFFRFYVGTTVFSKFQDSKNNE